MLFIQFLPKDKLMHIKNYTLAILIALFFTCSQTMLSAQSCNNDAPVTFTILPDGISGNCFLQINWTNGNMPEIACGSPGAPNGSITGDLIDMSITANGTSYALYDRGNGGSCNGFSSSIAYSSEANAYITTISNADFCLAGEAISIEGNRTGASAFDCANLPNSETPAPAELLYFKGQAMERENLLQWATSSEENVTTFVVEKSKDGKGDFQTVGSASAAGFSDAMEYYELKDQSPLPLTYYRLRTIDFDGSEDFSDWVAVARQKGNTAANLAVFPLPLGKEALQIYYTADTDEKVILSLTDISGKELYQRNIELEAGVHHWDFDLPVFYQGLLVLKIHNKEGVYSQLIPRIRED